MAVPFQEGMTMRMAFRKLALTLMSLLLASTAVAQITTGSITGVVTDPTGAVVVGATITATDLATNKDYVAISGKSDGTFVISAVPYGFYRVKVSAPGFSDGIFENVQVNVAQVSKVNAKLVVGSVGTEVVVASDASAVQSESIAITSSIDKRQIQNLPLNTRNPLDLVKTMAGSSTVS